MEGTAVESFVASPASPGLDGAMAEVEAEEDFPVQEEEVEDYLEDFDSPEPSPVKQPAQQQPQEPAPPEGQPAPAVTEPDPAPAEIQDLAEPLQAAPAEAPTPAPEEASAAAAPAEEAPAAAPAEASEPIPEPAAAELEAAAPEAPAEGASAGIEVEDFDDDAGEEEQLTEPPPAAAAAPEDASAAAAPEAAALEATAPEAAPVALFGVAAPSQPKPTVPPAAPPAAPKPAVPPVPLKTAGVGGGSIAPLTARENTARSTVWAAAEEADPHCMTLMQIKTWLRTLRSPADVAKALDKLPRQLRAVAHSTAFPADKMASAAAALHRQPLEKLVELARDASKLGKLLALNHRVRRWVIRTAGREADGALTRREEAPEPTVCLLVLFQEMADRVASTVRNKPSWLCDDLGLKLGCAGAVQLQGVEQPGEVKVAVLASRYGSMSDQEVRGKLEGSYAAGMKISRAQRVREEGAQAEPQEQPVHREPLHLPASKPKVAPSVLPAGSLHKMSLEDLLTHCQNLPAAAVPGTMAHLPSRLQGYLQSRLAAAKQLQHSAAHRAHCLPLEKLKVLALEEEPTQVVRWLQGANPRVRRWLLSDPALKTLYDARSGATQMERAAAQESRAALRPEQLPGLSEFDWKSKVKVEHTTAAIATRDQILSVLVKACDSLPLDKYVVHPVVKLSVVNARTGKFLSKPLPDDRVVSYFEGNEAGESRVGHIQAQCTQPYHVRPRRTITPVWDEQLLINCAASYMLHPDVLFLFEVLDFGSQIKTLGRRKPHRVDRDGWYRVAWSFLRPLEPAADGQYSWRLGGEMLRMQLYKYSELPTYNVPDSPEVWQHWNCGLRDKFTSTLYASIGMEPVPEPSKVVVDNSAQRTVLALPTQQEVGNQSLQEMLHARGGRQEMEEEAVDAASRRRREPGEACVLPSTLHAIHRAGEHGCNLLQFKKYGGGTGGYLFYSCVGKERHSVAVLEVNSGEAVWSLSSHLGMIYDLSFCPNERLAVTASADGTAKVWDVEWLHLNQDGTVQDNTKAKPVMGPPASNAAVVTLPHSSYVYTAKFHPTSPSKSPIVLTAGFDMLVRVWDVAAQTVIRTMAYHTAHINSLVCSHDGIRMFSASANGELYVCRFNDPHDLTKAGSDRVRRIELPGLDAHAICSLRLISSGLLDYLLVQSRDNKVRVVELCEPYNVLRGYSGLKSHKHAVKACTSPDGQFVLAGDGDGKVCLWLSSGDGEVLQAEMEKLPNFENPVYDVAWHSSQHMVAVAVYGRGQQVYLFSTELDPDQPKPALKASLLNAKASAHQEEQAQEQHTRAIKHETSKKKFFDEYMAAIYKGPSTQFG